jgi:hypothetical protein
MHVTALPFLMDLFSVIFPSEKGVEALTYMNTRPTFNFIVDTGWLYLWLLYIKKPASLS